MRLKGELDEEALRRSFEEIVRRHEVLRTRFEEEEGEPVQVIGESNEVEMAVVELRELGEEEREEAARERAREEAEKPFDLRSGPMLRTVLMRMGEEEHVLVVTMHHVVSDGWSVGVLIREMTALYEAYSRGEESPLAELEMQYADYAIWQREWLRGEVLEEQMRYWREELKGLEPLEMPTDRARPAVPSHRGGVIPFIIPAEMTRELKRLSQREGVTLFMTMVAGLEVMLRSWTGQEEIGVGTPIANRNREETEGLIGFFINQVVLRSDLRGEPTFREVMKRVKEVTLGAYEHQDVPFEKVVEEVIPEREMSRTPLFQVMMVMENEGEEELRLGEMEVERFGVEVEQAKFEISVIVREREGRLEGELEYARDLFEEETARRMSGHLEVVMEKMVRKPEEGVKRVSVLREEEEKQLIEEWSGRKEEWGGEERVVERFEEVVKEKPERVAVINEEESITYGELNERGNQLGNYLRRRGVGPEEVVGICMKRRVELVVGLLGVLKAGGAYLPIEVGGPWERKRYMLEEAQVKAVLIGGEIEEEEEIRGCGAQVISVDGDREEIGRESREKPEVEITGENLAYVIYTSGSTGQPKGVMVTQGGLRNQC